MAPLLDFSRALGACDRGILSPPIFFVIGMEALSYLLKKAVEGNFRVQVYWKRRREGVHFSPFVCQRHSSLLQSQLRLVGDSELIFDVIRSHFRVEN